jgi:tetrapyrrole methylase family protein/MazG family protein
VPGIELVIVPGLSFLDLAFERLSIDPIAHGVLLGDATDFARGDLEGGRPVLLAQAWSQEVLASVKVAFDDDGGDVVILHHLGLPDEQVLEMEWSEMDRFAAADHLTSIYLCEPPGGPGYQLGRLDALVADLRLGCPWDAAQSHRSLAPYLLEETYEVLEAIDALEQSLSRPTGGRSTPQVIEVDLAHHLEEELGDVLSQVVFHARLAREEGLFDLSSVITATVAKLTLRHRELSLPDTRVRSRPSRVASPSRPDGPGRPTTRGDVTASATTDRAHGDDLRDRGCEADHLDEKERAARRWELAKQKEKGRTSLLDGIPPALPALASVAKVEARLAAGGQGWAETGISATQLSAWLTAVLGGETEQLGPLLLGLARLSVARGEDPESLVRREVAELSAAYRRREDERVKRTTPPVDPSRPS